MTACWPSRSRCWCSRSASPPAEDLAEPSALVAALGALWPSYVGYLISFVTIGIIWANHHNLFRLVDRVSHGLILANLLLLLTVGFLPFPTALLAATLGTPSAQIGVLVYAGTFVMVAIAFNVLWYEIRTRPGVLRPDVDAWSVAAISAAIDSGCPATPPPSSGRSSTRRSAWA